MQASDVDSDSRGRGLVALSLLSGVADQSTLIVMMLAVREAWQATGTKL
jgi:hypothetical protein